MTIYLIRHPGDFPLGYGVVSVGNDAWSTLFPVCVGHDGSVRVVGIQTEDGPYRSLVGCASTDEARKMCEADREARILAQWPETGGDRW